MPPNNLFLDNNICINWFCKDDPDIYSCINEKINKNQVFISEYVLAEFIRTIVLDACALYSILIEEDNLEDVESRIYSIYENGTKQDINVAKRYVLLMESIEYENAPNIDTARKEIKTRARWSIKFLKTRINVLDSKIKCALASEKPKRQGLSYRIDIPCKDEIHQSSCSIIEYIQNELSFLNLIFNKTKDISEFKKLGSLISIFNQSTVINCSLKYCKILGDVIIVNDCPKYFCIVSRDEHFKTLCDISSRKLIYFD